MKKTSLLFSILLIVNGLTTRAQPGTKPMKEIASPQVRAQAMVSKIYSACNPAGYQASKINYAFIEYYSRMDELEKQPRPDKSDYESKQKMWKDKLNEKLQGILSPEQMRMWEAYKQRENVEL